MIQYLKTSWYSHCIPIVFPWISYRSQDLVAELPWILGQEEEQVVVMLGIPRGTGGTSSHPVDLVTWDTGIPIF